MRCVGTLAPLAFVVIAACGGGAPPPEAAPPAAAASDRRAAVSTDAGSSTGGGGIDSAALEKLTLDEAKSGNCDADHKAALEKLLDEIESSVRAKSEEGKPLAIESFTKRVLALSETSKGIQLTLSGKGTQVHVIALGPKEISLDVLAGNQPATTTRSLYRAEVTPAKFKLPKIGDAPLEGDSRQIEMKPGTPLDVRMRGQGCAGVVVFSKS